MAGIEKKNPSKQHVDQAVKQLQKNQLTIVLGGSYHYKLACASLARITFLSEEQWHSTSELYSQYQKILLKDQRKISYRRFSEMLVELVNSGIAISQTISKGRKGYGSQFKLAIEPNLLGISCFPEWWKSIVDAKTSHQSKLQSQNFMSFRRKNSPLSNLYKSLESSNQSTWKKYVGKEF